MSLFSRIKSLISPRPKKNELISVVLHFRRPLHLGNDSLQSAIIRAWGRDVSKDLKESLTVLGRICFISFDGMILHLTNTVNPYCPAEYIEQALMEFSEMRQKKVVQEHKAFLAIDLMRPKNPDKKSKEACYRRMARLAAEFIVDDNFLGVYLPETGHLRPFDNAVIKALRSEQPWKELEEWGTEPVVEFADDDPKVKAAVEEARRHWPEFVQAFEHRTADQVFSVKAPFTDGERTEWMWVIVSAIEHDAIKGRLGNAPLNVRGVHENDPVTVQGVEIGDWVYQRGEDLVGDFSMRESKD